MPSEQEVEEAWSGCDSPHCNRRVLVDTIRALRAERDATPYGMMVSLKEKAEAELDEVTRSRDEWEQDAAVRADNAINLRFLLRKSEARTKELEANLSGRTLIGRCGKCDSAEAELATMTKGHEDQVHSLNIQIARIMQERDQAIEERDLWQSDAEIMKANWDAACNELAALREDLKREGVISCCSGRTVRNHTADCREIVKAISVTGMGFGPEVTEQIGHGRIECVCGNAISSCRCLGPHKTKIKSPCECLAPAPKSAAKEGV